MSGNASLFAAAWCAVSLAAAAAGAADWPQWLGPQRDAVWRESGVVRSLPEPLPVRWRAPVSLGYAGPAVADGRVFIMDYQLRSGKIQNNPGARDKLEGVERVLCLDAATGKLLWEHAYDRPYHISFGGGPRCTPAVDDGRVYALGAEGNLWCLEADTGKVLWSAHFGERFGAPTPMWGFAGHPLVDGDTLYCLAGGEGSVAVALDKRTGRERWRALSAADQGYCPPTMIEHGGRQQLLIWHSESINSLDPATGKRLWSVPLRPMYGMSIIQPRKSGNRLFVSGIGAAAVLELNDDPPGAEVLWRGTPKAALYAATVTPFLDGNVIYGCDVNSGALIAASLDSGERLWQTRQPTTGGARPERYGTAFLVKHEDRFFLFNEQGDLILARLTPEGYQELGRRHVLAPTNHTFGRPVVWSHPAFAQQAMFARNDNQLVCVDLAAR